MQTRELYQQLVQRIELPVSVGERQTMIRWLLEDRLGIKAADLLTGKEIHVSASHFAKELQRINEGEPLQYILGHAEFFGRRFNVNSAVLIPRPETELLVYMLVEKLGRQANAALLDIGTGSGCIATTLALEMVHSKVLATDIDPAALAVAKENAQLLNAHVAFQVHDILNEELPFESLDAIISNPPYIRELEKAGMALNVTGFEPHKALFVPDDDPMLFHRVIAQKAWVALKPGGLLVMEINEALGNESREVVASTGFSNTVIHKDLDHKDRFVTGVRSA